jgi:membrane fusion protein, multidrug efflux system
MNQIFKYRWNESFAILICALVGLACLGGCQNRLDKNDEEKPAKGTPSSTTPPAKISFENGQVILTLDQQTQTRMGIEFETLTTAVTRPQVAVPAVVLSVQELATIRNTFISTRSQIEKDRVDIDVARKEYSRLKMLFDNNQNISEKALQSAEGSLRTLEVDERTATQQLNLQASIISQQWGDVVTKWVMDGSPEFEQILEMREVLLQATFPLEQTYTAPTTISVESPGRAHIKATLISSFPRVDSRIQGRSFLYASSAQPDLTPGINLLAHIAFGNLMRGVTIPASAVLWSEGRAWTYVQMAPDQFSRREIPTDVPVDDGYFASVGFSPGSKIVRRGAQSLFSEESVLQGYGGGQSDEN